MSQTQTQTVTNGESKSLTLEHLGQYPVVNDSITTFKSYPLGQKSIELADAAYARVGKPLEPHLRAPYSYAKPYVNKADSLADQALSRVDRQIPMLREDTNTIFDTLKGYAFWPFQLATDGRNYVFDTFNEEYKRTTAKRQPGLVATGFAIVSTEMHIASDALQYAADLFNTSKGEIADRKDRLVGQAKKQKDTYAQKAKDVKD